MNINLRRLIYISIIIIFIITAPIVLLESSGFRYDFKKHQLVKTGSLVLESYPPAADIYIDGEPYQKLLSGGTWKTLLRLITLQRKPTAPVIQKTPLIINNLIPNEYTIELKKPNYQTWSKKIEIKSREATFVNNILLFLEKPDIQTLIQGKITLAEISPDDQKLAFLTNQEVRIMDIKTEKIVEVYKTDHPFSNIIWSPTGKRLVITEQKTGYKSYLIIDIETGEKLAIKNFKNYINLNSIKWNSQNENLLYGKKENTIYQVNLFEKNTQPFLQITNAQEIDDFLIDKNWNIFYLEKDQTNWCLKHVSLTTNGSTLTTNSVSRGCLVQLPLGYSSDPNETIYELSKITNNLLLIRDKYHQKIWIINTQTQKNIIETKAKNALYLSNSQSIIYYNNFEIWQIDLENQNSKPLSPREIRYIVSRFSSEIQEILPEKRQNYLFVNLKSGNKNLLSSLELDSRDRHNIISLIEIDKIHQIYLSKNRNYTYVWGKVEAENGIYKIKIH